MKTIFCDVDGCLLYHLDNFLGGYADNALPTVRFGYAIPGARETLLDWWVKGYKIILTTGRPENEYQFLKGYLDSIGFYFHKLIMECGSGLRVLVNDVVSDSVKDGEGFNFVPKAKAENIKRNIPHSLKDLNL